MFHTYVDLTNDGKIFYVGMGDDSRVTHLLGRNKHHSHVAKKHGQIRKIVESFETRQSAVELEIKLIAEHHTFTDDPEYNGIGCNYTRGGEGCACNEETKQKISTSIKRGFASGRNVWNKGKSVSYNVSDEEKIRRSKTLTEYNKTKPRLGKQHSDETRAKMKKAHTCSICARSGHTKTTCPDRPIDVVNAVSQAQRERWNRSQKSPKST